MSARCILGRIAELELPLRMVLLKRSSEPWSRDEAVSRIVDIMTCILREIQSA
jgi:hypothetical protein